MDQFLETTYDKFIFRASTSCHYSADEIWVRTDGDVVVIGITDFQQKAKGDVAFLETVESGTDATKGQEIGKIETIKATFDIVCPVSGRIVDVNHELESSPFLINEYPYGAGWIYRIQTPVSSDELKALLSAEQYFQVMQKKVAEEAKKLYG